MMQESRGTILIVDDSADMLSILNEALTKAGYSVFVAMDGLQAISIADSITPDLILLDALMPHLDGFDTCVRLKQSDTLSNIPIIFMTGLSDSANIVKGLQLGGVDYVTKPVKIDEVIARVELHLMQSKQIKRSVNVLNEVGKNAFISDLSGKINMLSAGAKSLLNDADNSQILRDGEFANLVREWRDSQPRADLPVILKKLSSSLSLSIVSLLGDDEIICKFINSDVNVIQSSLKEAFGLTERESEVLVWLTQGKTNHEIADILFMSARTVNKHLEHIFKQMMVENRIAAVSKCFKVLNAS